MICSFGWQQAARHQKQAANAETASKSKINRSFNFKSDSEPKHSYEIISKTPPSTGYLGLPHPSLKTVVTNGDRDNPIPQIYKPEFPKICYQFLNLKTQGTRSEEAKIRRYEKFSIKRKTQRTEYRNVKAQNNAFLNLTWGRGKGKDILGEGSLVYSKQNPHEAKLSCSNTRSAKHIFLKTLQRQTNKFYSESLKDYPKHKCNQIPGKDAAPKNKEKPDMLFKLKYQTKIKIATLNLRGIKDIDKQEKLIEWATKENIDILALQETYFNTNSKMKRFGYTFIFSTGITDKQREEAKNKKAQQGKGKGKHQQKLGTQLDQERHGVAFVIKNSLIPLIEDVQQINGRIAFIKINDYNGKICIINTYNPHAGYDYQQKEQHYYELQQIIDTNNKQTKLIILGDFNTRLQGAREYEKHIIGQYIYGYGPNAVEDAKENVAESRTLFLNFCEENELIVTNTMSRYSQEELYTFSDQSGDKAQIDFITINKKWKNSLKHVQVKDDSDIYSDHRPLIATLQTKIKKEIKQNIAPRYLKPNKEQTVEFNKYINEHFKEGKWENYENSHAILTKAAESTLSKINTKIKKSYITEDTWELIQKRQNIKNGLIEGHLQEISKEIKRAVSKDRTNYVIEKLENTSRKNPNWNSIKELKQDYTPNFTKIVDSHGKRVQFPKRAAAIADYLEQTHWKGRETPVNRNTNTIHNKQLFFKTEDYTLEELDKVLQNTNDKKASGPDNIQAELYKALDSENRTNLLQMFNKWNKEKKIDKEITKATVVSIFKKGDTAKLENYRPISLLNASYKIYSALIKNRLEEQLEQVISETQYGFRKTRSCANALHIVRRINDFGEMSQENVITVFLDWEKAFDKVNHNKLIDALKRIGLNQHFLDIVANFYSEPTFQAKYEEQRSEWKKQTSGIRQGCTLSPYLFILLMTVLMYDVKQHTKNKTKNCRIPGITSPEILFADDTTLVATNTRAMHALLHEIEFQSETYGLKLNKQKCVFFAMNKNNKIHFLDGEEMKETENTTYLGANISKNANIKEEISMRLMKANAVWHKLKIFWRKTKCTTSWKIQVYDAVVKSTLLYGLETLHITKAQLSRLNTFHLKGLRHLLNIQHTFINRSNTNEFIWKQAERQLNLENPKREQNNIQLNNLLETLNCRRIKFMGHLLRAKNEDPTRSITFQPNTAKPIQIGKRRIGGPKKHWTNETLKLIWEEALKKDNYVGSNTQLDQILMEAKNRTF